MSAVPFTEQQRLRRIGNAQVIVEEATDLMPRRLVIMAHNALRWNATLRKVEAALAKALTQRDELAKELDALQDELRESQPWRVP